MAEPKISVLIPMYNRKHYIADAVNSVLGQTFQDFEIIIRDDGSTDGGSDFVREKYPVEIANGRIKLMKNPENIGEFETVRRLFRDANGKYICVLHSDDMILSIALQHLYETAEKYNADVVHSMHPFKSPPGGVIDKNTRFTIGWGDLHAVKEVTVMPNDPIFRLTEWYEDGTFCDLPYNLLNRNFILQNGMPYDFPGHGLNFLHLHWLMTAKVFVKTPVIYYIYRDSPDSLTRSKKNIWHIDNYIHNMMRICRRLDELFSVLPFIKDHEEFQRLVKFKFVTFVDNLVISRTGAYDQGFSNEVDRVVEKSFDEYLGNDGFYSAVLFNWLHSLQVGQDIHKVMLRNALSAIENKKATPPHLD